MVKRIFTYAMWTIVGAAGLLALLLLYVAWANRHDQPPSPAALRMQAVLRDAPAVADKDNGYIYFVGMSTEQDHDPHAVGMQRIEWTKLRLAQTDRRAVTEYPGPVHDFKASRSAEVNALVLQCRIVLPCAPALATGSPTAEQWLAGERWLVERYSTMLAYPGWREIVQYDPRMAIDHFEVAFEGQNVYMLDAWSRARRGDADGVKAMLERDLRFWRRSMASSTTLVGKMVSGAAIRRHFSWANLVLRSLPANKVGAAIPDQWRLPISDEERSLLRSFAGESAMFAAAFPSIAPDDPWSKTTVQFQDTYNRRTDWLASTADALAVSYAQLPAAADAVRARTEAVKSRALATGAYNLLGDILFRVGISDMTRYAASLADIEGVRRATLLMSEFRSRAVPADQIAEQLVAAHVGSPYDGKPFAWDANGKAIVVTGLVAGPRGQTTIPY